MNIRLLALAFINLITLSCFASNDIFSHLVSVNREWLKQKDIEPILRSASVDNPANYNVWIATHLMLVEQTLRARSTAHLSDLQRENRHQRLNELHSYRKAGTFPVNDYVGYKTPVFIDRKGTHCAVGQLMMTSGRDDLAQQIDSRQKFAYISEIKVNGVKEWADENGFTLDELAWIQPGYPCVNPTCADGTVKNVSCYGSYDGCIGRPTVTIGQPPYVYEFYMGHDTSGVCWNGCPSCDLPIGDYTYRVTNAVGARQYFYYTLTQPDSFTLSNTVTPTTCFGSSNASLLLTTSGSTPPYIFHWSDGDSVASRTGLMAGVYTVTITDQQSCSVSMSIAISQPAQLAAAILQESDTICVGQVVMMTTSPSGGTPPYQVSWTTDNVNYFFGDTFYLNSPRAFTLIVADNNGCSLQDTAVLYACDDFVGVDETDRDTKRLRVYPNPVTTELIIDIDLSRGEQLTIYDLSGKAMTILAQPPSNRIDISALSAGAYIAEVKTGDMVRRARWVKM